MLRLQINYGLSTISIICFIFILSAGFGYLFYNYYLLRQLVVVQNAVIKQQIVATTGIIYAGENERRRMAGDLHDGVGQLLSATKMNLDTLLERLKATAPENLELIIKTIFMVDEGCREVRAITHQMMPKVLLKAGLVPALRDFVNKIESRDLKITLETLVLEKQLNSNTEIVLYRVVQEAVNNAVKHAKASLLDIQLTIDGDGVSVTVEDNGQGFDTSRRAEFEGLGLKNIVARVTYLKGTVDISSSPGMGTLVAILIPLT